VLQLGRYQELFRSPDVAAMMVASVVGRLPIGVAGLAILLYVHAAYGSFVDAGVASALYVMGLAWVAPLLGRLIDRIGPRPVLLVSGIVYPAALLLLAVLVTWGAHPALVAVSAFLAGAALPPISICVRAGFPRMLQSPGLLQTAYSVDSALVEIIFILGPTLVAGCVAAGYPVAAVLLAGVAGVVGSVIFLKTPAMRAWLPAGAAGRRTHGSPLGYPHLRMVFAATILYSVAFGLFEVAVTAHATAKGLPAVAGIALALTSVGSALGAVVYGSRSWRPSLPQQFLLALILMSAGLGLLVPVDNLALFSLVCIVAGIPMASVIAAQALLISRLAPREILAEGFTWGSSCLLGGIGAGIAAGGVLAEFWAAAWILLVAAGLAGLAALLVWLTLSDVDQDGLQHTRHPA